MVRFQMDTYGEWPTGGDRVERPDPMTHAEVGDAKRGSADRDKKTTPTGFEPVLPG